MAITDLEPFRPYIDRFDLTEEQKLELVNTIAIMAETVLDKHFRMNRADLLDSNQKPVDHFKASSNGGRYGSA